MMEYINIIKDFIITHWNEWWAYVGTWTPVDFVAWGFIIFLGLLVSFAYIMKLEKKVKGTIWYWPAKITLALPFVLVDWIWNYVWLTPYFMDLPRSWNELATGRFQRYLREEPIDSRKYKSAKWVCDILHKYDPGHCD